MSNAIATKDDIEIIDAPARSTAVTPYDMVTQAVASGASLDVVGRLLDLHERWEANKARKAFDAAMSDAKAEIPPIIKNRGVGYDSKNGGSRTSYRHEDLAEVARTIDPILAKHGLSYRFQTVQDGSAVRVTCIIAHRDGHSVENSLTANNDSTGNKNSIQAIGSTITYLQRYTLKAALGLAASNDDDGRKSEQTVDDARAISDDQATAIHQLLIDTKSNVPIFLKYFGVANIEEIPASKFDTAVSKLNAKKAQQAKESTNV